MKSYKRILSCILALAVMLSVFPANIFAEENNEYSITNGYLTYTFNADTGGFAIETAEGNPKKLLDNNIPLLYAEDKERSNGTSFITVRIDGKDYIFGQDYGIFGLSSKLDTPVISEEGRLITIPWTIKGITVRLKAALGTDADSDITGNAGISFEVENNSGKNADISIRLLLDTAFGNDIDAPYFIVDTDIRPTMTETEFKDDEVPAQVRCVDSLTKPSKLSYIMTKGWNGGTEANRMIVGHWANLANTRYAYTPDNYCDFTNYSNDHREPDSAAALYWENKTIENGQSFTGEVLYGVGNFSDNKDDNIGINITAGRVELADDKQSYKNDGKFTVTVEVDNTVDGAVDLSAAMLNLTLDDNELELVDGNDQAIFNKIGHEVVTQQYTLKAKPQSDLTAGTIYVSLVATAEKEDGTQETVETAAQRSVVIQSVKGNRPEIQMNKVNPEIVWTGGEKAITVSGKMAAFKSLSANQGWNLRLKHTTSSHSVLVEKKNVAFLDDAYENMSFTTSETLEVGEYKIVFEFDDPQLQQEFGKSITCSHTLQVSSDEKYRLKSYGTIALVRTTDKSNNTDYDFYTFRNEGEYLQFCKGEISKLGELSKKSLKYNFFEKEASIAEHEIVLTVRADLREMERGEGANKERYWQASAADGDIIINNMLSYEGEKPLEISEKNGAYTIKGDGLIKVINSINVWRSKWSFTVNKSLAYTLDTERFKKATSREGNALVLSLDGAATMIQSIGGFLVDLKFGELSSSWNKPKNDGDNGVVTYGIGFGGSISIPISAKKKKDAPQQTDLTADQEDMSDALQNLFDESLTADAEDMSGELSSLFDENPKPTSKEKERIKKDTKLSEGQLSAEVNNVLFGEDYDKNKGAVSDTGFIGIDAQFTLALPQDVLGSLVSNAPGIYASVTINTIENVYELSAGLNIKVIECEGTLAFKEVEIKNKDVIVPDKIEFYIRDGLRIPLVPPAFFMTGLGGGINELADTIGGEFDTLPPITLLLFTRLELIGTLVGDFDAKISLEGLSLKGDMKLRAFDKLLNLNAGIYARWIDPWELNLYGNVSIIDGLIKGGITVTIAKDYFYGYIFASICIPESVPLVGGKELAGVEAAVSDEFIGANIKIIGIKFGVIYYWGDKVSFGKNIDLSAPARNDENTASFSLASGNADDGEVVGYYGTNIHSLPTMKLNDSGISLMSNERTASVTVTNAEGQDALLFEIPYSGTGEPKGGEITLENKDKELVQTVEDDGNGNGNMLVQSRDGNSYIYVTVTEKSKIKNGKWTVKYTTPDITIDSFTMNGVDDVTGIDSCSISNVSETNPELTASWKISGADGKIGCIDVYLTEDKDILNKIKTSSNNGDSLGINVLHKDNAVIEDGSEKITLPDTFESGTYYAVTTVSSTEGISLAISSTPVKFKNTKLPKAVSGVHINYGGNGNLFVKVTDPENTDYTHYLAEIVAEDGTVLSNNIGQFEKGANFVFGKEAYLETGKTYYVNVKTLREEKKETDGEYKTVYYYGEDVVSSNKLVMPDKNMPKLLKAEVNFDTSKEYISQNSVTIDYTFENDVFVVLSINGGQKAYSGGETKEEWTSFKKNWTFVLDDLEDGDYVIDFTAYTKQKDHITGKDAVSEVPDAQLGFTIDTSAPVLSLTRTHAESIASTDSDPITAIFGSNTVMADSDGNYTIEGITERASQFTVDGEDMSAEIAENGGFAINKKLADNETHKAHYLKATDNAGNVSELMVYAVRPGGFAFDGLTLESNNAEIPETDGVKNIKIKNGQSVDLSAALSAEGKKFSIDNSLIEWSVLYEKNTIAFNEGIVTAVTPGETAVKAKLNTADIQIDDNNGIKDGLADYVVITVENNSKSDLADKIEEAEKLLNNTPDASDEKKNALQDAIDAARETLNNPGASESDYTNAVSSLTQAMNSFNSSDPKPSSGGGGGTVTADKASYTITVIPTEHGKVTLSHMKAARGTSVTVTAVPDEGYTVDDILINGESVGRTDVYTIKSIAADTTVKVIFGEKADLPFTDVLKSDWFYDTVKGAYDAKLMAGMSETKFEPYTTLSRAMFVTILHRLDGEPDAGKCGFNDVEDGAYYEKAVAWANANGIVKGVSETEFAPDADITREQMAAVLYRYAGYKNMDTSAGENTNILSYEDYAEISEYAIPAMQWTAGTGLITGRTKTTLNPKNNATRAEAAAVFMRFSKNQ